MYAHWMGVAAHWLGAAPKELINALDAIAESTVATPDGPERYRPRYSQRGIDGLRRLVVSWNPNPRLLDLAFLTAAIEHEHAAGALDFFFSARSFTRRSSFRNEVASVCGANSECHAMDGRGLVSRYDDTNERVLHWNEDVLVLPPLFDLLCDIDPGSMIRDCDALREAGSRTAGVLEVAGAWQKRLYHWLRDIVSPLGDAEEEDAGPLDPLTRQRARHFSYMVKWLRDGVVDGHDAPPPLWDLLDDERVLAIWRAHWPSRSLGERPDATVEEHSEDDPERIAESERYRSFEHVADLAMHLWNVMLDGRSEMSPHLSIMTRDEGDGETISEDILDEDLAMDMEAGVESLLRVLDSPLLSTVKFLKETEKRVVEPVAATGAAAHRLPLTLLRAEVFGARQRSLGRAAGKPVRLAELLACEDMRTYDGWVEDFKAVGERIATLRDCCLHVLVHLRSHHAVGRIREELRNLSCWDTMGESVAGTMTPQASADDEHMLTTLADMFFRDLASIRLCEPALNRFLDRIAAAFRGVNTQGFKELPDAGARRDGVDIADIYAQGDRCLHGIAVMIGGFLGTLRNLHGSDHLDRVFTSDRSVFQEGFTRIYAPGDTA